MSGDIGDDGVRQGCMILERWMPVASGDLDLWIGEQVNALVACLLQGLHGQVIARGVIGVVAFRSLRKNSA